MPDIREITEEKIFRTFGKGVPICNILTDADINAVKSMLIVDQAIKQISPEYTGQIKSLEIISERQKLNLAEIRSIKKEIGCK